ncbi:asparagine N-glycosylation enzyme membrane subunit Stt3 [Nocardioides daedukensis]|uniref:Asparagine N-glycosylation enzyme membrane subunit Stt3 n=1 Tax=Nocardioides daedukensis TaxID=634462 RepID=A0A7Y9URV0_9ACTN|nr:asparagine N-glycosylation enzyme membrane subunit Stt3 [Nocardioides daedukensis]
MSGSEEPDSRSENKVDLRKATEVTKPRTLGGLVYLGVLAGALTGVVVAALGPWRVGVSVLAVSMLLGAGARLMIPEANTGMLKVRNRYVDAAILVAMGVAIIVLATTIPDQIR